MFMHLAWLGFFLSGGFLMVGDGKEYVYRLVENHKRAITLINISTFQTLALCVRRESQLIIYSFNLIFLMSCGVTF